MAERATVSPPPQLSPTLTATRLQLTLPVPPSINHQYATVHGRRVMSSTGRAYKAEVGHLLMAALSGQPHRMQFLDGARTATLTLTIHFFFASALRRDVDGGLKIAQDAVCGALGVNDNRVTEIHLYKKQDRAQPRMELTLELSAQRL